jgi:zinc protease
MSRDSRLGRAMKSAVSIVALFAVACGGSKPSPQVGSAAPAPTATAAAVPPSPDAWRKVQPPPGQRVVLEYPAVETGKLDNGLSLYVVRRPAGVVSMSVVALGGAARVPAGKSGLAALTVRMMTEGTTKHSSLALAEAVESLGTSLEQSAGRDFVRLGMTTLRENMKDGLALLAEVVKEPSFAPKELERVRHEWLDSIEAERQSPARLSSLVGLRVLLGTTVGAPVSGSRRDVEALKRPDLVDFYSKSFVPGNLALVVVGDVGVEDVKPIAASLFLGMRTTAPAAESSAPPPYTQGSGKVFVVDRPGAVQSALFIAQPFPKRSEPGYEARELLNALLGGVFTSRLNMNLRETHAYTYGATSLDLATRGWGALAVLTSVRTDVTGAALKEALTELRKARDPALGRPITEAEVALSRALLEQHLGATLSHTEEVAERVEELFYHALPADYLRKYPTVLDGTTPQTIADEARRLDPDHAVIVVVGDKSKIGPQLDMPMEAVPDGLTD